MSYQQHQSSLAAPRRKAAKPCIGDRFPMRRVIRGRWNVFAFEHSANYWHRWSHFETKSEALIYCRGKFVPSCGVRIVSEKGGKQTIVNPFPKATPALPCMVEFGL